MKNIIMKSISAGPDQEPRHIGTAMTVGKDEAARLVVGGYAEYAQIQPSEAAVIKPSEPEPVPDTETAEGKPQRGKKK